MFQHIPSARSSSCCFSLPFLTFSSLCRQHLARPKKRECCLGVFVSYSALANRRSKGERESTDETTLRAFCRGKRPCSSCHMREGESPTTRKGGMKGGEACMRVFVCVCVRACASEGVERGVKREEDVNNKRDATDSLKKS